VHAREARLTDLADALGIDEEHLPGAALAVRDECTIQ
jgi:hypothetical protein